MSSPATLDELRSFPGKYPRQLWYLFFSEMWERFCFYGMRGMLTFFMIHELFMDEEKANLQYGATQAWVYAFTFIGGLFADKILGFRRSLFWGGLLMIAGSLLLAADPHRFFFLGIAFNIVGTGFFKPNISTMVGLLYHKNDYRRDAGFSLFYSGINIGALLGGYVCIAIGKGSLATAWVPEHLRWNVAFGFAAVVMTISLLTFLRTRKLMGPVGLPPESMQGATGTRRWFPWLVFAGSLLAIPLIMKMVANTQYTDWFMYFIGPFSLLFLIYEMTRLKRTEVQQLIAALLFILFSVLFWAIYEQAGGSLNIFAANNVSDRLLGAVSLDPNGVNNSANALFVIILAPLVGLLWIGMAKRKIEPNTIVKFGLSFLFLGGAYYLLFAMQFFGNAEGVSSLDVFTLSYLVVTLGELCLSPIGLSIMTKLSPGHLQGFMMGMWFLASAYGQYVAGLFGADIAANLDKASNAEKLVAYTNGYKQFAHYAVIAGLVILLISPLMKKLMHGVR